MDRKAGRESADDSGYEQLVAHVQRLLGIDLRAYKREQMQRRLTSLARRREVADLGSYALLLEQEAGERQRFLDTFTINVSEFFRDDRPFRVLETEILPRLQAERRDLYVWSAGCSNGAELYSIAMLLAEGLPGSHRLIGSDIDGTTLERARRGGPYVEQEIHRVSAERRERFLRQDARGEWWVKPELLDRAHFARHDLLAGPYEEDLDLITCRNVIIYLTRDAKTQVFARLAAALRPGGVLMVGGTEMIFHAAELGLSRLSVGFYTRIASTLVSGT